MLSLFVKIPTFYNFQDFACQMTFGIFLRSFSNNYSVKNTALQKNAFLVRENDLNPLLNFLSMIIKGTFSNYLSFTSVKKLSYTTHCLRIN